MSTHLAGFRGSVRQWLAQLGQIYFQCSAWTGLVILGALAVTRPWAAVGMGLASLTALGVSRVPFAGLRGGDPKSGLWGYNASLTDRVRDGLWLGVGVAAGLLCARGLGAWLPFAATQSVGLAVNLGLIALGLTVFERGLTTRAVGLCLGAAVCLFFARMRVPYFTLPFNLVVWMLLRPGRGRTVPAARIPE